MSDDRTRPKRTPTPRPPASTPTPAPAQHSEAPQPAPTLPHPLTDNRQLTTGNQANTQDPPPTSYPRFFNIPNWLSFWLPIVTSILSLVIAVASFISSNQDPDVHMILPDKLYMAQGAVAPAPNISQIYLEPSFVSTGRNDRLDVITNITLKAETTTGQPASADFIWAEIGAWDFNREDRSLNYVSISLRRALMVSPSNPQLPVILLQGPEGWNFNAGTYKITVTADRAVGKAPLQTTFTTTFSQGQLDFLTEAIGTKFLPFPITP